MFIAYVTKRHLNYIREEQAKIEEREEVMQKNVQMNGDEKKKRKREDLIQWQLPKFRFSLGNAGTESMGQN